MSKFFRYITNLADGRRWLEAVRNRADLTETDRIILMNTISPDQMERLRRQRRADQVSAK